MNFGHSMAWGDVAMTFGELKQKDVINLCDGRRLGKPVDMELNDGACVCAIIVPSSCGIWGALKGERDGVSIPWSRVRRIGDDVILVEITAQTKCE